MWMLEAEQSVSLMAFCMFRQAECSSCTLFTLFHLELGSLLCLSAFHSNSLFLSDSIFVLPPPPFFPLLYPC